LEREIAVWRCNIFFLVSFLFYWILNKAFNVDFIINELYMGLSYSYTSVIKVFILNFAYS
jgi:hypothetical protein